jgi:hypothetical protein
MKTRWIVALAALTACVGLPGCATNSELTQKEKERLSREMGREMERESRKKAQAQEKMMRGNTPGTLGGQRAGSRE